MDKDSEVLSFPTIFYGNEEQIIKKEKFLFHTAE